MFVIQDPRLVNGNSRYIRVSPVPVAQSRVLNHGCGNDPLIFCFYGTARIDHSMQYRSSTAQLLASCLLKSPFCPCNYNFITLFRVVRLGKYSLGQFKQERSIPAPTHYLTACVHCHEYSFSQKKDTEVCFLAKHILHNPVNIF